MVPYHHIEKPAANRTDGLKITEKDVYKANPLDGPATFSKYAQTVVIM